MKILNIAALGLLATVAFSGCEMKEELYGGKNKDNNQGNLELGIAVKQPYSMSRAETVSADNFPVTIEGSALDNALSYAKATDVPSVITLPVGTYKVSAHSPGELTKQMTTPYYAGEGNYTISKGANEVATVICKMKNTRVQLSYGEDFFSNFKDWTITIAAGKNNALEYKTSSTSPAPVYLNIEDEKVESIIVNVTATTNKGASVVDAKTFKKSDASESYSDVNNWFEGGDAITINMGAVKAAAGTVTGITINAKVTFENKKDEIIIDPSESETPVVPETPDANAPTMIYSEEGVDLFAKGVVFTNGGPYPTAQDVTISAPKGLKSVKVTIEAGNEGFQGIVEEMNFTNRELIGDTELKDLLSSLGVTLNLPEANATSYVFPIGTFYKFMDIYGATDSGKAHKFIISVEDNDAKKVEKALNVTINAQQ